MVCGWCLWVSCDWLSAGNGGGLYAWVFSQGPISNTSMYVTAVTATNNTASKTLSVHAQLCENAVNPDALSLSYLLGQCSACESCQFHVAEVMECALCACALSVASCGRRDAPRCVKVVCVCGLCFTGCKVNMGVDYTPGSVANQARLLTFRMYPCT